MIRSVWAFAALAAAICLTAPAVAHQNTNRAYDVVEKSLGQLRADLLAGRVTSVVLVKAYLSRIDSLDRNGPRLHSVIAINPNALSDARARDVELKAGHVRGVLQGIPILIKDNIETADPLPTTAGSLALTQNITGRDSPLVARLRAAGAVILGKANLSEWANIRSSQPISGWSAVGGLARNPYAVDRSACGSSAGSAVAAASSFAAASVGTETDGSIVCPASVNGIVGLKPTVGLIPRTYIVPISHIQDTAGPMARSVSDIAVMLTVMAGSDPRDPATIEADGKKQDYTKSLDAEALKGKRIGVMRALAGFDPHVDALFEKAIADMKSASAVIVEISAKPSEEQFGKNEFIATLTELKVDLNAYLASTPAAVKTRSLADIIAFDRANASVEMPFNGQEFFEQAEATKGLDDPAYRAARATAFRLAGPDGIDKILADNKLDALIAPTTGPTFAIDPLWHDHIASAASGLPAVAGYPHLTVPMGEVMGLPIGISFIGPAWSEARLLGLGFAFEQRTHARRSPSYVRTDQLPAFAAGLEPHS